MRMMTTIFGGGDGSSEEVAATATAEVVTEADFKITTLSRERASAPISLTSPSMAFPVSSSFTIGSKSFEPTFPSFPTNRTLRPLRQIIAVHVSEPAKSKAAVKESKPSSQSSLPSKWAVDSWKMKTALQLPEYSDVNEFKAVIKTMEGFPPLVVAGEARGLEEKIAKAFLLQGGDCAESFKEFSANNIRDTFRVIVLLQMGVVLMFGGQMPVIKSPESPNAFLARRISARLRTRISLRQACSNAALQAVAL